MKKQILCIGLLIGLGIILSYNVANAKGAWDSTKEVTSDVWDGTKEVASDVWEGTKEVTSDVWDGTKNVASDVKEGVTPDKKTEPITTDEKSVTTDNK
ncbi:MAG: hypothetical protein IJF12_05380 [Alphaproteobacteria bacterium]|nr:hypothetical protein [Alphaproteobacteria bacterium]MBQ2811582.1 hypothetical protein [Alphaproteobacteria bacterium]